MIVGLDGRDDVIEELSDRMEEEPKDIVDWELSADGVCCPSDDMIVGLDGRKDVEDPKDEVCVMRMELSRCISRSEEFITISLEEPNDELPDKCSSYEDNDENELDGSKNDEL